jgi:excisionase family DNA binding protein
MIDLNQINPNALYTTNELCKILKVNPVTLRYYIKKKYIPAIKFGSRFLIKGSELLKVLDNNDNNERSQKIVLKIKK